MKKTLIDKAMDYAKRKHKGQKDDCGKDYFKAHVLEVYHLLRIVIEPVDKSTDIDENLLCAGLLHDIIEDTDTTYYELRNAFSRDIADLVNEVTHEGDKESGYYFPRLRTQRGIMIKFADRLSNISRMETWDAGRQQHYLKKSRFWKASMEE